MNQSNCSCNLASITHAFNQIHSAADVVDHDNDGENDVDRSESNGMKIKRVAL